MSDERSGADAETDPSGSPTPESAQGRFDDEISTALRALLHQLEPGARLPNERELAEELGVSRNALRDRVRLLESVGVLARRQGSGTYLEKTFNPDGLVFAMDLLVAMGQLKHSDLQSVRVGLERQAAIQAASGGSKPELIAEMRSAVEALGEKYDTPEMVREDVRFHRALIRAADNPALAFFADALRGVLERATEMGTVNWREQRIGKHLLVAVHADIIDAVEAQDPEAASHAVDEHFSLHERVVRGKFGFGA
ncbi:GntR family L-lactate dehydrogenase operon transcriptional regulator [Labedella gwakjiensis]|uniref:FadR family transcriptional regulator n=1 Tax=Labedella gwakjiensis TaxID=390269 RepID=A0A2P8GWK6_9MICO|nr:FCD domain-containing protein [Labedella gwakjiensis]PSL38344.1 GntR family L-lactate dehydrogenase operon transcriptional regulator [Labedella gwakjiensis]RUQ87123.1 FadR family transcriptional regulator [Labedella gwakjiensis]